MTSEGMMKIQEFIIFLVVILTVSLITACAALRSDYSPPLLHPNDEGEDLRTCTDCHDPDEGPVSFEQFNHGILFAENHGTIGSRYGRTCSACHRDNFCTDCHGFGIELKPSVKYQTETYRRMPHRGDYLSRHIIDGRLNPASCYRCHRTPKSYQSCKPCHG